MHVVNLSCDPAECQESIRRSHAGWPASGTCLSRPLPFDLLGHMVRPSALPEGRFSDIVDAKVSEALTGSNSTLVYSLSTTDDATAMCC